MPLAIEFWSFSINPYEPPTTVNDFFGGFRWTIRVGVAEINEVCVSASLLKGVQTYVTDADGNRGPVQRGPAEFEVGQQELHAIRIEVDETGKVNAHVDGKQVGADLFPRLRRRIQYVIAGFVFIIAILATLGIVGGLLFAVRG